MVITFQLLLFLLPVVAVVATVIVYLLFINSEMRLSIYTNLYFSPSKPNKHFHTEVDRFCCCSCCRFPISFDYVSSRYASFFFLNAYEALFHRNFVITST